MTYRMLHGLTFQVWSPSNYELVALDDGGAISMVSVAFDGTPWTDHLGSTHSGAWRIYVLMKQGHTIVRGPFQSFAHACECIAFGKAKAS